MEEKNKIGKIQNLKSKFGIPHDKSDENNKSLSQKILNRKEILRLRINKPIEEDSILDEKDSDSEEYNPLSRRRGKKKSTKKIRKKKILKMNPKMEKLRTCTSKSGLRDFLHYLTPKWKNIIKFYMTECFIFDLYIRRLENKMFLLSKRHFLFSIIEQPDLLTNDCHFDNNLLKNFCTGLANFIYVHYDDILRELNKRKFYFRKSK